MKKINKLLSGIAISTCIVPTTLVASVVSLSSCANGSLLQQLENTMIQEFKEMCKIPHSSDKVLANATYDSGNVWQMSCYLRDKFEKLTGQYVCQDKYGNIWFDVPANTDSLKDAPILAMQAHMDMVFSFDASKFPEGFKPDPKTTKIQLVDEVINGKRILHSKDYATSIGADNGLGVAQIIAILSNQNVKHGKLRIIITNCEENAMQGAKLLVEETNPQILKDVKYVLNIDGEDLGDICVACSGGVGSYYSQTYDVKAATGTYSKFTLGISGLSGGHSGGDIDKHRINALKVITDVLKKLSDDSKNIEIANFATPGLSVYNKIANACNVSFATDATEQDVKGAIDFVITKYENEDASAQDKRGGKKYSASEIELIKGKDEAGTWYKNWSLKTDSTSQYYIDAENSKKIIQLQDALEYGPKVWPTDAESEQMLGDQTSASVGPVVTSLSSDNKTISYKLATYSRSNVNASVTEYKESNITNCHTYLGDTDKATGQDTYFSDATFPGWQIDANDKLRNLCKQGWLSAGVDSSSAKFSRTHGGVEPAWWHNAMTGNDTACVSYGPQLTGAHEPDGTVDVSTVQACLKTTMYMLEHAKELN